MNQQSRASGGSAAMNSLTRKKDTGEPGNGGQFGSTARTASGLTLSPPARTELSIPVNLTASINADLMYALPRLPEHLGEPQITFGYGSDRGERNVYVWFGDEQVSAWEDSDGCSTSFDYGDGPDLDEHDTAQVRAYLRVLLRNVTNAMASLEGAIEDDTRIQRAVAAAVTGRSAPEAAESFNIGTYDGTSPLPRPLTDSELGALIRQSPDGHTFDAMVSVPAEDFLNGVRAGSSEHGVSSEHDVLAQAVHPALNPYDSSYRIAGTDTDGNLLVHYFHGDGGYEHIIDLDDDQPDEANEAAHWGQAGDI